MGLPLVQREGSHPIAHFARPVDCLGSLTGPVGVAQFLDHVDALAAALPEARYLLNLCGNRYLFMVSFCAAILRGQTNLLPPNPNPATQLALAERHPGCVVLHDGIEIADGVASLDMRGLRLDRHSGPAEVPCVDPEHLAAISFTSGSTGQSKPNPKPWQTKFEGALLNARYMLPGDRAEPAAMLATVPGQHMWGLETSVMLALVSNLCVSDQRPLYPADIRDLLGALPGPRVMVSTPVHLRAMVMSGLAFPKLERVLCATAPLESEMAAAVERCFNAKLVEIYGCSEVGSMAWRRTVEDGPWTLFDAMQLMPRESDTVATADHVPGQTRMQDLIELLPDQQFRLLGRQTDLIDIAGKRGSLKELNEVLGKMHGVLDGVVFLPPQKRAVPRLAAMVVVEPGISEHDVVEHFRAHLDAAFVPRRILLVDALPRAESGKLPHAQVLSFYETIRQR